MTYKEKLLDPRWQKKRLEIFQRDHFTCLDCGYMGRTLSVHHGYYPKCEPWECPDEFLWTLCEVCHEAAQQTLDTVKQYAGLMPPSGVRDLLTLLRRAMTFASAKGVTPGEAFRVFAPTDRPEPLPGTRAELIERLGRTTDHETAIGLLAQIQRSG